MDPVCISLVHQFLKNSSSALADQFKTKHQPEETNVMLSEVISKWNEEQLGRAVVHQHLKKVAPYLALEFKDRHSCFMESIPQQLVHMLESAQGEALAAAETGKVGKTKEMKTENQEQNNNNQRLGRKQITFSTEHVKRLERAVANKEDLKIVAMEIGRSYASVQRKAHYLKNFKIVKKGKFTADGIERILQALEDGEDFRKVALDLNRTPETVHVKMMAMKINPMSHKSKNRSFSLEEDLLILDKILPQLKSKRLSDNGFLPQSVTLELATECNRNPNSVRFRWGHQLQPWLLQHYTALCVLCSILIPPGC